MDRAFCMQRIVAPHRGVSYDPNSRANGFMSFTARELCSFSILKIMSNVQINWWKFTASLAKQCLCFEFFFSEIL